MTAKKGRLSIHTQLGYGVGTLSYAIPFQLISACLVFYATAVLGISGTMTALILSLSTIWDAVTDPVMGYISDHTNKRILFGRRLFYVLIGAIGIAVCNYLLWCIDPALPRVAKLLALGGLLILLRTFSTIFTTPYLALGAELSRDYNERTTVQSYRSAFFFFGFMYPTIIGMAIFFRPTPEFINGQLNPQAYESLGLTTSIITLVCAAICIVFTNGRHVTSPVKRRKGNPIRGIFKETAEALKCSDFRNVSIGLLFVNMAMGIVGAVGMHVFTYTFGFGSKELAVVFGALFLMALASQPIWAYVANKTEKRRALLICLSINIVVSIVFALFVVLSEWISDRYLVVLPLALLMGLSIGGSIALPYSMISDTIDKDAYYSGTRKEGVFYGCATFMFKLSQSLAVMFVGILLDVIRFNADSIQPHSVYLKLGMILPVGFFICFVMAFIFIKKYTLTREIVVKYQQKLG